MAGLWFSPVVADELPDFRRALDEARRVSYKDWQQAQELLDHIAPLIEQAEPREFVDFQLLQARHDVLADRTEEGLARATELLSLDLADDQRLRVLQFSANVGVLLRRYESAFASLSEALSIDVGLEDPTPRIATLNMAAYMPGRVGEYERGIEYGAPGLA
ncbi:MAG: hypothetical protein ACOCVP_05935, partial [Wenzhouxiangella sp.]